MEIPNWNSAVKTIRERAKNSPELIKKAQNLGNLYINERGLMIVDCVSSRQRRYETYVVPKLIPQYRSKAKDMTIRTLASKAPEWMPLRDGEAKTMQQVAKLLASYGKKKGINNENQLVKSWALDLDEHEAVLAVNGIGPALLQYLRMLSGANSLKVDVRVLDALNELKLPINWFSSEGVLKLCEDLANAAGCTLVELDQLLWNPQDRGK